MTTASTDASRGRLLVVGVVAVAVLALGGLAAAEMVTADGPDGETVLNDSAQRYASAESVTGNATVTVTNGTETETATVEFAATEDNSSRLVVHSNGSTAAVGTNGTVAWVYAPSAGIVRTVDPDDVNETALAQRLAAANDTAAGTATPAPEALTVTPMSTAERETLRENVRDNVTITRTDTTTLDGEEAYVVEVASTNESVTATTTAWVSTDDSRLLRVRVTDGEYQMTVDYSDQRFNASIHPETFKPPTDRSASAALGTTSYERYDALAANASVTVPELDADGYAFREGVVGTAQGETIVAQRYAGPANVTVVTTDAALPFDDANRTVTVDGQQANVTSGRDRTVVYWTDEGTTYAVTTEGSVEETVALARNLS
jgi:outer membrane lipoprotein-sorting protein